MLKGVKDKKEQLYLTGYPDKKIFMDLRIKEELFLPVSCLFLPVS